MAGNPPSYDSDHPPPQWPRLYRNEDATLPFGSDGSEVVAFNAPNQSHDHLGPIGKQVDFSFSETFDTDSSHTMTEFLPEKHIYLIQFLHGLEDSLTVDDVQIQGWDCFIEMLIQLRQQMIDEFNVYFWICYTTYDVMVHDFTGELDDRKDSSYPAGPNAPYFEWFTRNFVPTSRIGDLNYDLPSFCCVIEGPIENNLTQANISAAINSVTALGGPGLEAGRTALGIVGSYPTYNTLDNTGLEDLVWDPASGPLTAVTRTTTYQTFVPDRNSIITNGSGQTVIDEADTKPSKVDFSGRGSGTNVGILAIDSEAYVKGDNITFSWPNMRAWDGPDDDLAAGPLHPQYFPYPHPWKNYWAYYSEPFNNYPLNANDGDATHPTTGYPNQTLWRGYQGFNFPSGSGWSSSPYTKFASREGAYVNVDVELKAGSSPRIRSWNKLANFDGLVGEPPSFVGTGALRGNPHLDANTIRDIRSNPKGPVMAAQVIWRDHMGGPNFRFRGKGVKNLVAVDAGNYLDYREDEAKPGDIPTFPGVVTRPTVILTWDPKWTVKDGSWPPLVPPGGNSPSPAFDEFGTNGGRSKYTIGPAIVSQRGLFMQIWEVRWAFDEATLTAGGGNSILTIQTTTANAPENLALGVVPTVHIPGPISGGRIPISHGKDEETEIFFTVLEYNIKERNALSGKMILQGKNSFPTFTWISPSFPYKTTFPRYGSQAPIPAGSLVMNKFRNQQDWTNIKHLTGDITVTSAMIGADPEA